MYLCSANPAHAQLKDWVLKMLTSDRQIVILPAFFVSPETSVGAGLATMYHFRLDKDSLSRPSNMQSVFIYTLEKQVLFTNPFDLFLKKEKYWFNGEMGFYIYPYHYYGEGPNISTSTYESYSANYMSFEVNALKKLSDRFYMGPTVFYDHYFKVEIQEGGMLESGNVTGIVPDKVFGLGGSLIYDRRDNLFSPREGYYLEGRALFYENEWIGGYQFTDMYVDARKYFHLDNQWETGFQLYHQSILGEAPFYNLAQLGNSRIMRGYYSGAYRDNHLTAIQTEVRHYLLKRVVVSAFGGLGSVSDDFLQYDKILGNYGIGLRYEVNSRERIRIRFDYARGHQSDGFYINVNEAF